MTSENNGMPGGPLPLSGGPRAKTKHQQNYIPLPHHAIRATKYSEKPQDCLGEPVGSL